MRGLRIERLAARAHGRAMWAVFALFLAAGGVLAADFINVSGSKLRWSGKLPSGWVGGTARQIERIAAETDHETLRKVMREMLIDAKTLDAYFSHLDVTGTTTRTLSSLRINAVKLGGNLADAETRKQLWLAFATQLNGDAMSGATTTLVGDLTATTGGRLAYEATFKTTQADGGVVYVIMHLVALPQGPFHIFQLKADTRKINARRTDLRQLLSSIRYE